MKITHKMIADATGFTQSTVSKALSATGRISEETTAIIRKAANEMGYYSQSRKTMRSRESYLFPRIAILVPEIISWHYSNIITKLQEQIEWLGGSVCVYVTGFSQSNLELHIEQINRQNQFDGIIVLHHTEKTIISDIPVLFLMQYKEMDVPDTIYMFDLKYGIDLAIRHLTELGHTEIGFIGEKNTASKLHDFRKYMLQMNLSLQENYIYTSGFRFERIGHDGIRAFHIRGSMPTGIICAYDEVAFGAIEELTKLGYHVPEEISVVGINNIEYCTYSKPPLTTLQNNISQLIEQIMDVIRHVIIAEEPHEHCFTISPELIVRSSTAPYRES